MQSDLNQIPVLVTSEEVDNSSASRLESADSVSLQDVWTQSGRFSLVTTGGNGNLQIETFVLKIRQIYLVVQDSCCEISESVEEEFNIGLGKPKSASPTGWLVGDPDNFTSNFNHVSLLIATHWRTR